MFATCIFCNGALGANETLEHFPVGRKLAFDAAKGRLWVVCPKCERWNLSPIEERWEAIEEAERAYRDTRKRIATDNIGLARVADGTDLVRIGAPLRPEFAAWRYGEQLGRRRRKHALVVGGTVLGVVGIFVGAKALAMGAVVSPILSPAINLTRALVPRVRVRTLDDRLVGISRAQLSHVRMSLAENGEPRVAFAHLPFVTAGEIPPSLTFRERMLGREHRTATLEGERALRAMSVLLPALNGSGGSARQVASAVTAVEQRGTLTQLLKQAEQTELDRWSAISQSGHATPKVLRLAMEMTLHEDAERIALEGELHELENRWREADEIAAIADSLTLPERILDQVKSLRGSRTAPRTDGH